MWQMLSQPFKARTLSFDSLPNQPRLHPSRIALFSPGGEVQCEGQFTTTVTCCNKNHEVDIFVISGEHATYLLGDKQPAKWV